MDRFFVKLPKVKQETASGRKRHLHTFGCLWRPSSPKKAVKVLIPFTSAYLCECGFSVLTSIKSKYRSSRGGSTGVAWGGNWWPP